jgi:hypothetical protein
MIRQNSQSGSKTGLVPTSFPISPSYEYEPLGGDSKLRSQAKARA